MSRFDWNPDSHLNMSNRDIIDLLTRDDFLRELHHLLWMEPAERRGKWDPGWNCRDHAFIVGFVVRLLRSEAVVILGRAMFIVGPSGEKVPLGLEQSLHAWIAIDGDGYFDLSIRLDESVMPGGNWFAWPVKALAANQFVPSEVASFIHTAQAANFEQKIAIASHAANLRTAVYLRESAHVRLTKRLLFGAFQFCNSPLTTMLRNIFGERPDLYARAALHLYNLLEGEAEPLVGVSQRSAWETLSQRYAKSFLEICSKASLK
jgi:hypothetical protein